MKGTLYALTRNKNDVDSKEKLDSMLQKVDATGAAFINGKNILADSIFARQISAEAIITEHMAANTIKGDRIEVGTLNGDRITANTITSNMIHTSGLDAGVIKTGTISAGNGVSVINMANGEFSLGGGKIGYVASTNKLYVGAGALFLGELPIEEHNRMVGSRQSAETQKTAITNEKQALDARYTSLYGNVSLTGTPKTDLATKYSNATTGYTTRYNSLVSALNAVIAAPTNTTIAEFATLQTAVTTATSNYTTALFALNTALELATKTIENAVAAKAQADATAAAALDATTKAGTAETNAKTHANTQVGSIEIGGRNLWKNSNYSTQKANESFGLSPWGGNVQTATYDSDIPVGMFGLSEKRVCVTEGNGGAYHDRDVQTLEAGTYTISFWARGDEITHNGYFVCLNTPANSYITIGSVPVKSHWQRFSYTVNVPTTGLYHRRSIIYKVGTTWISNFKLEKGNKATDWTPAPEDVSAEIKTKAKTFTSTPVVPYNSGDVWKNGITTYISTVTRLTGTYTVNDWTKVGDVTIENTAKDTTMVGGTAAATIVSGASAGTTANSTVTANKSTWDRASSFDASGNLATTKLTGTVSDTQIASATAWNNAKTLVSDITTDGTLTPFEKQTLKPEYDAILKEKIEAVTLATNYIVTGQSYYTNYIQAYDALYAGMNTMMTTGIASNSTITRSTMNGWFTNYYEKAAIFQRNINETARTIASGAATSAATANELAKAMTSGKLLYKDPVFSYGTNSVYVYNNSANSNVVHSRITKPADAPTNSTHLIEIKNIGAASPGIGGFVQNLTARANAKFVVRYIAKIPIGYTLATASNEMGTSYTDSFLTATAGTGKYEEYIRVVQCGATGSFSNGGHVYLNGAAGSVATPVVWYVARIDTYDVTDYEPFASHINADPNTVRISGSKLHFTDQVLMDNAWIDKLVANSIVTNKIQATDIAAGRITSGSISADRIAANSLSGDKITANTIDATRLKIGSGAQGGYINNPRFSAWSGAYPDGTILWSAGGISKVTVDTVPMAQFAPAAGAQQGMQLDSSYFANGIDLDGMQYFALECRFRLTSGTNPAGASFLMDIYRQDGSSERLQLDMKEVGASVTTNAWYVARKIFKLADANVAKTFKSVSGYLLANWSGAGDAAKTIQFASVNMFQASAQEFLAQSWTNGGTTSINGGFIATGTLSADKITTGSLNASLITTGALNASLITTGNFNASRITAGVISAGNGKSTIDMSTGAFNFGSGKIAYDGTTLLLNVDSLKIINSSVATEVYASLAAGTAKTEAISAAATDATSKVNSIEIGGRNLWIQSNAIAGYTVVGGGSIGSGSTNHQSMQTLIPISAGKKLIYQVWNPNKVTSANTNGICYFNSSGTYISQVTVPTLNGTNYQTVEFVAPANTASARLAVIQGATAFDNSVKIKFEIGTKATDWTPAPEDVQSQIDTSVSTTDVEYYLSTSSTLLSGGSWVTTAPAWVNGKFMWSRTKVVYNNGTTAYKPSANGTCIAGATGNIGATGSTGAVGTGITSITEEYYLSTSKTSQTGDSWVTTPPTWSTGKYMWTRSKIVYNNPTSTVYTTAVVDSSWEAVNEIQIGARNIVKKSNSFNAGGGATGITTSLEPDGAYKVTTTSGNGNWNVGWAKDVTGIEDSLNENDVFTISFTIKRTLGTGSPSIYIKNGMGYYGLSGVITSEWSTIYYTGKWKKLNSITPHLGWSGTAGTFFIKNWKIEKGNKATDWTPAPEDVAYEIEQKADSTAVADAINSVSSSASGAQAIANAKLDKSAYDNFIKEYGEYKTALAADQSVASGNLQATQTAVASIQNEMGNMKESWTFNNGTKIEATGNGMLISDGNPSGMNMLLSQNRLSFFDGGVEVAYIADKTMKINHGIFVKSAQIGSHLISTSPANSDITIVSFVGED